MTQEVENLLVLQPRHPGRGQHGWEYKAHLGAVKPAAAHNVGWPRQQQAAVASACGLTSQAMQLEKLDIQRNRGMMSGRCRRRRGRWVIPLFLTEPISGGKGGTRSFLATMASTLHLRSPVLFDEARSLQPTQSSISE